LLLFDREVVDAVLDDFVGLRHRRLTNLLVQCDRWRNPQGPNQARGETREEERGPTTRRSFWLVGAWKREVLRVREIGTKGATES